MGMWTALLVLVLSSQTPPAEAPLAPATVEPAKPDAPAETEGPPWPLIIAGVVVGGVVIVGTGAFALWALATGVDAASQSLNRACGDAIGGLCTATCVKPVTDVGGACGDLGSSCTSGADTCTSSSDACGDASSGACSGVSCAAPANASSPQPRPAPARIVPPSSPAAMAF
jgi:hypothetical protein